MQQRRLRLGDILDDYCPRERRITNHAVVAMIGEEVRQTRCTTCDAEHEYKHARVPPARKKKGDIAPPDVAEGTLRARTSPDEPELVDEVESVAPEESFEIPEPMELAPEQEPAAEGEPEPDSAPPVQEDEGPVHRPLIRATLPRPEGQAPERKPPEFTIRQPGSRGGRDFDGNRNGHRQGRRGARPQGGGGQSSRFGDQGPRHGSGHGSRGPGQGQRPQGNRPGGNRGGGRPGPGGGQGRGGGRKRGR